MDFRLDSRVVGLRCRPLEVPPLVQGTVPSSVFSLELARATRSAPPATAPTLYCTVQVVQCDADAPHERVARAITSARQFIAGQQ